MMPASEFICTAKVLTIGVTANIATSRKIKNGTREAKRKAITNDEPTGQMKSASDIMEEGKSVDGGD